MRALRQPDTCDGSPIGAESIAKPRRFSPRLLGSSCDAGWPPRPVPSLEELRPPRRHRMRHALSIRVLSSLLVSLGPAMAASSGAAIFQPGFHQALRTSVTAPGRTTYRMKLPIGRAGSRLRLSFQAGDGSLTLHSATVALAGTQGALAGAPAAVTFGGAPGFSAATRARVTSDPVDFPVSFGDE